MPKTAKEITARDLEAHNDKNTNIYELQVLAQTIDDLTDQVRDLSERLEQKDRELQDTDHELQSHRTRTRALFEINQIILEAQSPEETASAVTEHILELVPCWRASVTSFNPHTSQAIVLSVSTKATTRLIPGTVHPVDAFGCSEQLQQGLHHLIDDSSELVQGSPLARRLSEEKIRSAVYIPLLARDELIGTLNVEALKPQAFSTKQVKILCQVADQLAVGLQRALLIKETFEALSREQHLSDTARTISGTLDLRILLDTLPGLTAELVEADSAIISLTSPDGASCLQHYYYNLHPSLTELFHQPKGEGLCWHIIETRESILLEDYRTHPLAVKDIITAGLRAYLGVPIIFGDLCLGALTLFNMNSSRHFQKHDLALIESIAKQAGLAIHNARLFEMTQRQLTELFILHRVAAASAQVTNEDELIRRAIDILSVSLYSDFIEVSLVDEVNQVLRLQNSAPSEPWESDGEVIIAFGEGIIGTVAAQGEPIRVPDTSRDPRYIAANPQTQSELCVPIKVSGRVMGVINAESYQIDAFSENDEHLMITLAGQLASSIERLRAESALRQYNQRLEILRGIDQAVLAVEPYAGEGLLKSRERSAAIAQVALSRVQELIPCQRASVTVFDFSTGEAHILAVLTRKNTHINAGSSISIDDFGIDPRLEKGDVVIIEDMHASSSTALQLESPVLESLVSEGIKSVISIPMTAQGELIGVLNFAANSTIAFTSEQIEVARELADVLAVAIQQASLYEEVQRYSEELEERVHQRTAELEEKNRELETFTYSVSHDLKAPLRGIDGYSRLLLEDYVDGLDDEGRVFLHSIRSATDQMNQLINDLLTYSRLERREMVKDKVHLPTIVQGVVAESRNEIQRRGINLSVEIPCLNATAEAEGLSQALRNLIDNALKFAHTASQPSIEIGGRELENSCILWVKDNGIGFDMKYHDRIFKIFQRLHHIDEYPGTGVGLALVHKAMHRMGGNAWAESSPGEGATFFLEIPK